MSDDTPTAETSFSRHLPVDYTNVVRDDGSDPSIRLAPDQSPEIIKGGEN
jgi:hypothetical protein